jgi:crotonobetainyl-CoA:carnitine CoA-transferase CaiB-like acyl-CoA transferase
MTSVTPFGQTGPSKDHEYTELTIFATGGAMYREGMPSREPLRYGAEVAQYFAGTSAAAATMAACFGAALTGDGRWIDVSIQECMAGHPHQIGRRAPFAYAGELDLRREPHTPFFGGREPYAVGTFRCRDGYASFLPLGPRMWPNFTRMIGSPELMYDPRFASAQDRVDRCAELTAIFQCWLDVRTRYEVFEAAQEAGLPGGPVLTTGDVMADPHFAARGFFTDIDHPDAGTLTYTGLPFAISGAPEAPARPAPRLGQHTDEVLERILGVGANERKRLRRAEVI